ncbi:uncharacterized protein N7515_008140 [Penicillium bovifimosum]|uniref:Reverse transcriptase domain-containing protein n=1 Tax=Penicillium bovifimosum TaxID=126998 RepID=A0A9W9KX36_9EURO|nr:uncharacterized protein N7515_008140 [Penicillium bovifimosum]KAJ5124315.1 hypothetical protein N7515_008140 [Penicillium bovifimosum]
MTDLGGTVGFKKAAASLKDWGPNPQIWTTCFLAYLAVVGYLFNGKHPKAVPNLLMFMRQILDFAQIYQWSIQAGPGCTIIKRDIKDAFRIVPVAEDNHLLAFQWTDSTYVECCLPFGLAMAPFLFNLFAEALHWILQYLLPTFHINHYLDAFIAITQSPSVSDPTGLFDEVYNRVTDYLRIPRVVIRQMI